MISFTFFVLSVIIPLSFQFSVLKQQWFIQPLPDVALATAMDGGEALAPDIDIGQTALAHLQRLLFDREHPHPTLMQGDTGLLQRARRTMGT